MKTKNILLALLFVLIPATVFAQNSVDRASCGPYMQTYQVSSLSGVTGNGIRCVKFLSKGKLDFKAKNTPIFAWYGEGNWNDCSYRHVGQALKSSQGIKGYASDIWGNGECYNGNYPGNLEIMIIDNETMQVTGSWNEQWKLVKDMDYTWMSPPSVCGEYFNAYDVYSLEDFSLDEPGVSGEGLRCELKVGKKSSTWVGFGDWNNNKYSHLGSKNFLGQISASDFCKTGEICSNKQFGELRKAYSNLLKEIIVRGWNEVWKLKP